MLNKDTTQDMPLQAGRHEPFLDRCRQLAMLGAGFVAPNPMVGAVLVADGRIIGEGWHRVYGQAHAEVNAVASVRHKDRHLISNATLYVSLEPCCTVGNTPACTDLIIREGIRRVVIGSLDRTPEVDGGGVHRLQEAGVDVLLLDHYTTTGNPAAIRNHYVTEKRPYIILKFAQSQDGFMGLPDQQVWLSHPLTKRLVHKWRSEAGAILVGTQTALTDNPELTNRLYFGSTPLRIVPDFKGCLTKNLKLLSSPPMTWVLTAPEDPRAGSTNANCRFLAVDSLLPGLMQLLYDKGISTLMVEGGSELLGSFSDCGLWDEARILYTPKRLNAGIRVPQLQGMEVKRMRSGPDEVVILKPLEGKR